MVDRQNMLIKNTIGKIVNKILHFVNHDKIFKRNEIDG